MVSRGCGEAIKRTYAFPMSTLAEIESAAERLPAAQKEELIRFLSARLPREHSAPTAYRTRTHSGRVRKEIDADKLGQLPEEF